MTQEPIQNLNDLLTKFTPYDAQKTAELDIQFAIDPSFGLNKQRFGWYSNQNFLDESNIDGVDGKFSLNTTATAGDSVRLRSAYPGQYIAHTLSEPGLGATIPEEHLEFSNGLVSLTHGEISLDIAQWSDNNQRALNSHGISFEPDATYHQVRAGDTDVAKVAQEDWNIDTVDGNGPSGFELRPEDGYIYLFIYSWYGEGAYILAISHPDTSTIIPLNRYVPSQGDDSFHAPNMPVQATVENNGTADPLEALIGGMQYTSHGSRESGIGVGTRSIEEARDPAAGFIDTTVVLNDEAVDPFAEPGVPLLAGRRQVGDLRFEKGLRFELSDLFANVDSDIYLFAFDEYDVPGSGLDGTFSPPTSVGPNTDETGVETNTTCTTYSPSTATIRGITYISSSKNSATTVTGDASSRIPLQATEVVTAALGQGENNTTPRPFIATLIEGF